MSRNLHRNHFQKATVKNGQSGRWLKRGRLPLPPFLLCHENSNIYRLHLMDMPPPLCMIINHLRASFQLDNKSTLDL